MDIVVHIGTEKTGTTSIQNWLDSNRGDLAECGLYYLKLGKRTDHRGLATYSIRDDRFTEYCRDNFIKTIEQKIAFKESMRSQFFDEVDNIPDFVTTALISSEHFHSELIYEDEIVNLKNLLSEAFVNIKIIVYLRRQVDTATSVYSTSLKGGYIGELSEYVTSQCRPEYHYYNYQVMLKKWKRVFGRNNITVRLFDKEEFINGNLIDDFIHQIDPSIGSKVNTAFTAENESFNHFGQCLMKSVNKQIPRFIDGIGLNTLSLKLTDTIAQGAKGSGLNLDEETYTKVQAQFAESNELVRKEYFPERATLFPERRPPSTNIMLSKEQEIVLDQVIGILGHCIPFNFDLDAYVDVLLAAAASMVRKDPRSAYRLAKLASYARPMDQDIANKIAEYEARSAVSNGLVSKGKRALERLWRKMLSHLSSTGKGSQLS